MPIHYTTFIELRMTIKGRLLSTSPMLKAFSSENFCPIENGPQNGSTGGKKK